MSRRLPLLSSFFSLPFLLLLLSFLSFACANNLKVNAGGPDSGSFAAEAASWLVGPTFAHQTDATTAIANTEEDAVFRSHRWSWAPKWGYDIELAPGTYEVQLGFAETWGPNQAIGKRVFDVALGPSNTLLDKVLENFDVVEETGGGNAAVVKKFQVSVTNKLVIQFIKKVQNPMVSSIVITGLDTKADPVPDPNTPNPQPAPVVTKINVGGGAVSDFAADNDAALYTAKNPAGIFTVAATIDGGGSFADVFTTHRYSPELTYTLPVSGAGPFNVKLMFAEVWTGAHKAGARIFNIIVNGETKMEAVDIYSLVGANKAYVADIMSVAPVSGSITITLQATVENAMLSGIVIENSGSTQPTEGNNPNDPTGNNGFDHRAHAVTGGPYLATDFDGDGFATVSINGDGSHSHFYDPGPPVVNGLVTSYTWKDLDTGKVVSTAEKFSAPFKLGQTKLELTVVDNTNDVSTDTTTVEVLGPQNTGAVCYYYNFNKGAPPGFPLGKSTASGPKPLFSAVTPSVNFGALSAFPNFPFKNGDFGVRCVLQLFLNTAGDYNFFVTHAGPFEMVLDGNTVIDAKGKTAKSESASALLKLTDGSHNVQLLYYRSSSPAALVFQYDPPAPGGGKETVPASIISHSIGSILPIITSISPASSPVGGGGQLILKGSGFFDMVKVKFGSIDATVQQFNSDTMLTIIVPKTTVAGVVTLSVTTPGGVSNGVDFTYSQQAAAPVKFTQKTLKVPNGGNFKINQIAASAYGPDGRFYFGSLNGKVYRVTINENMIVTHSCASKSLGNQRAILGIAFNPKDKDVKVHIGTSTLYWGPSEKNILPFNPGWYNGKIQVVGPIPGVPDNTNGDCLELKQDLITGLPVSNHDHGVNAIQFDNNGNLYVNIGGFTNAGIPHPKLGNVDENPLSAATVMFKTSAPGFNGKVAYSNPNSPQNSAVIGPAAQFVSVYAHGLRNAFGLAYHTNGHLYATDNGPNKSFGAISTGCNSKGGEMGFKDSLRKLSSAPAPGGGNKYFGHPNRNRGKNDPRQCVYYQPDKPSQNGFTKAQATMESSTNGIVEYRANSFGGALKGDLFCSKFAIQTTGKLFRAQLDGAGNVKQFGLFTKYSGLSIVEGVRGELIMPKVFQNKVDVLVPDYDVLPALQMTKVSPSRGPKAGGNVVLITGFGFGSSPTATFGGKPCTNVIDSSPTEFKCTVPAGSGSVSVVVTTSTGATTPSFGTDYTYMKI